MVTLIAAHRLTLHWREALCRHRVFTRRTWRTAHARDLVVQLLVSMRYRRPMGRPEVSVILQAERSTTAFAQDIVSEADACFGLVTQILPDLSTTRFHRAPEFYSLMMAVRLLHRRGLLSLPGQRRRLGNMLRQFSDQVAYSRRELRQQVKTMSHPRAAKQFVHILAFARMFRRRS